MPARRARRLMRGHSVEAAKGRPRRVRKTLAGDLRVTNLGRPASRYRLMAAIAALRPTGTTRSLLPLPMTVTNPASKMKMFQADAAQFRQAQAGGVGQFQHRLVAQRRRAWRAFPA